MVKRQNRLQNLGCVKEVYIMANDAKGVWRTINGRHIFIEEGQTVDEAMKKSFERKNPLKERAKEVADHNLKVQQEQIAKHQEETDELNGKKSDTAVTKENATKPTKEELKRAKDEYNAAAFELVYKNKDIADAHVALGKWEDKFLAKNSKISRDDLLGFYESYSMRDGFNAYMKKSQMSANSVDSIIDIYRNAFGKNGKRTMIVTDEHYNPYGAGVKSTSEFHSEFGKQVKVVDASLDDDNRLWIALKSKK